MEPIFPEYTFGSVSLPLWQNNIIRRFSEHRKYRIFLWEFGPTLLDHLHIVKEGKSPDYTKRGLILTYSIASIALFISFASTRRAAFTAAITSGVILLGVVTTVAIDYQKTKRKGSSEVKSQEYCIGLLEALGNTPRYWWWPWSKKIKDADLTKEQWEREINYDSYSFLQRLVLSVFTNVIVHQWHIVQYGYIYNYQQLTKERCMLNVGKKVLGGVATALGVENTTLGAGVTMGIAGIIAAGSSYLTGRHTAEVGTLAIADKFSNLIRAIILSNNVDNDSNTTLNEALESFELKWLLMNLDISLKDVEAGKKSKEEHNRYAKDRINDVKRLSLKYHPDVQAGIQNANSMQQRINAVLKALNNVHDYVMKEKQGYGYIYRLFGEIAVNLINSGQDLFKIINIAACSKLHDIAYWEEGRLMESRNQYLEEVREHYVKPLKNNLGFLKKILNGEMSIREARNILDSTKEIRKKFEQRNEEYQKFYEEIWVENLKSLSKECKDSKELEIIKLEVGKLLKEGETQYKILKSHKKDKVQPDEIFVEPILEYSDLINAYCKLIIKLCENIESCFRLSGSFNGNFFEQQKFVLGADETEFTEISKKHIKELSCQELFKFANLMVNYYYNKENGKGLQKIVGQYYNGGDPKRREIGSISVFVLNQLTDLLEGKFEKKETFFEKEKKRTKKAIEESNDIRRRIEETEVRIRALEQSIEQSDQARRKAEQSIEQSLVVQAASFMRVAESSSDRNKMTIYQAQVKILKDLLMLYRETNSRVSLYLLSDDKVYQAREEVHTIHEEMRELVKEIERDVVLNPITRAEDLVKKSGTIMLNLKKYKWGEEDYKRLEQEVNNLIEQEAQRAEQEAQARQRVEQKAEQNAQRAEQEAQRAARLEEMLRKMGVDPDTALDDVNVSQGASAGIGKGSGAGI